MLSHLCLAMPPFQSYILYVETNRRVTVVSSCNVCYFKTKYVSGMFVVQLIYGRVISNYLEKIPATFKTAFSFYGLYSFVSTVSSKTR